MRKNRKAFELSYLLKCSAVFAATLGAPVLAFANPTDGVVSAGSAVISEDGKKLNINQSSDKAIIDWRTFNIAPDETTQFRYKLPH